MGKCTISPEDNDGMTPLHIACQNGHIIVARFLLDKRTDIDHEDTQGHTPLNYAIKHDHKDMLKLLIMK